MKTRKILAMLLTLAMMMGLLCTGAAATGEPTGIAVYVYKSANDYAVYELGTMAAGTSTALQAFAQADSTAAATYTTVTNGTWLYTINGNLASYSAADYTVQNNDFLAFYLVPDYTVDTLIAPSYYTEWMIDGVLQSVTTNHTLGNDLGMETGLNYAHPTVNYISATSAYQAKSNNSPLTSIDGFLFISGTATGHNVLTTCYPVKLRSIDSTWIDVMRSQAVVLKGITDNISATEIGQTAKDDLDSKAATAVGAPPQPPILMGTFLNFEDAFAALSYSVDARLDYVAFTGDIAVTEPFYPYITAYTVQSTTIDPTAVPNNFTMTVTPKDSTATVSFTYSTGVSISGTGNTRLVTLPDDTTSTITVAITKSTVTKTYTFTLTTPPAPTNNASVYAFLPAPGQFTNEGMGTGGWGDIYNAAGDLKMNETTGVSLGYFGGYVVYQFDSPVKNSKKNSYGADFIVYGNALWNNSEPGAIQVSADGTTWYDIAGYRYYTSDTVKNYKLVYGNPNQESDPASAKTDIPYDVYINDVLQSQGGFVTKNNFHNHLWFPLYANYFASRTINNKTCPAIPKYSSFGFADYDTTPATINGISCYRTLTLSGTMLSNVTTGNTASYGFGYADVHPNNDLGGNTAYNPYLSFSDNNDYATKTAGTSGGDPIDISWAVDANGEPVSLSSIQYVRIYTAAAQNNGVFGEISTEVCGIAAVSPNSSNVGETDYAGISATGCTITDNEVRTGLKLTTITTALGATSATITLSSSADRLLVDGATVTNNQVTLQSSGGTTQYFRVIAQTGTQQASIIVVKVVFQ